MSWLRASLRVEHAAGRERADHPPHAHEAELRVDGDLGELRAEGQQAVRRVERRRAPAADRLGVGHAGCARAARRRSRRVRPSRQRHAGRRATSTPRGRRRAAASRRRATASATSRVAQRGRRGVHGGADHRRAGRADRGRGVRAGRVSPAAEARPRSSGTPSASAPTCVIIVPHAGAELRRAGLRRRALPSAYTRARARCAGMKSGDRVGGGGHAGADQPVAVAARARRRVAVGPAEALGAAAAGTPRRPSLDHGLPRGVDRRRGRGRRSSTGSRPSSWASSSIAVSSTNDAERLAGPAGERRRHRVAADQPVHARGSSRRRRAASETPVAGSAQSSNGEVIESFSWRIAVRRPVAGRAERRSAAPAPRGGRATVNICGRVSASLTGRPT